MLRVLGYAILTAVIVFAAVWVGQNPAQVEITWLGYQISTSFAAILVFAFVLWVVLRLIFAPFAFMDFLQKRATASKQQNKNKLMIEFLTATGTGDSGKYAALGQRIDSAFAENPELRDLMLLNISSGATKKEVLENLSKDKGTKLLALKTKIEQAEVGDNKDEALTLYKEAFDKFPKAGFIAPKYISLLALFGRWDELKETAKKALKYGSVTKEQYKRYLSCALLEQGITSYNDALIIKAADVDDTNIAAGLNAAKSLGKQGHKYKAFNLLERLWKLSPCIEIYDTALLITADDKPYKRLKKVEKLIKSNKSAGLKDILLADIYAKSGLWGQAKSLAARYEDKNPSSVLLNRVKAEIANGENPDSAEAKTLSDIAADSPLPCSWQCQNCSTEFSEWHAICPTCTSFGTISVL